MPGSGNPQIRPPSDTPAKQLCNLASYDMELRWAKVADRNAQHRRDGTGLGLHASLLLWMQITRRGQLDLHADPNHARKRFARNILRSVTYPAATLQALRYPRLSVTVYLLVARFYFVPLRPAENKERIVTRGATLTRSAPCRCLHARCSQQRGRAGRGSRQRYREWPRQALEYSNALGKNTWSKSIRYHANRVWSSRADRLRNA